jgi:hypothetical protein
MRYLPSRGLYGTMGVRGVYTRKKGLDHETNKALLEKHLQMQGADGAPLAELLQVLPALGSSPPGRTRRQLHRPFCFTVMDASLSCRSLLLANDPGGGRSSAVRCGWS